MIDIKRLIFLILLLFIVNIIFSNRLTIATANIYGFNEKPNKVTDTILKINPDILIILEWSEINLNLNDLINHDYYTIINNPKTGTHGIAVLAKTKFQADGQVIISSIKGPCQMPFASASFIINNMRFTIFGVHLPPPLYACQNKTEETIKEIQSWVTDGKLNRDIGSGKKGDRVIIAGDFNTFSFSKIIKKFSKLGLIDSHEKSDKLYEPTWSPYEQLPKLARIDYIFVTKYFRINNSRTYKIPGSDHKGIICEISLDNN